MKRLSDIRTIEDLDRASAKVRMEIDRKADSVLGNVEQVRAAFQPVNLFAQGLRFLSRDVPFDRLLLAGVRAIRSRLLK